MSRAVMVVSERRDIAAQDEIRGFTRRRASEAIGMALVGLAMFILLAVCSYHSQDPSWNVATASAPLNLMGYLGSYVADILLQTVGVASLVFVLVLLAWGWRLFAARKVRYALLRLAALIGSVLAGSMLFALPEAPLDWPIPSGLGGSIGVVLWQLFGPLLPVMVIAVLALLMCVGLLPLAMGLRRTEWAALGRMLRAIPKAIAWLASYVRRWSSSDLSFDEYPEYERPSLWSRVVGWLPQWRRAEPEYEDDAPRRRGRTRVWEDDADDEEEYEVEDLGEEEGEADEAPKPLPRAKKAAPRKPQQASLALSEGPFELPDVDLLNPIPKKAKRTKQDEAALAQNARMLENVMQEFGVQGKILDFRPGPVVTLYQLEPAPGTRSSRVINLAGDIARSMSAVSARISVVPGSNAMGIELPNSTRETVYLRELLECDAYLASDAKLPLALGKNIGGDPVIVDLAKMPHLLVAGTTGSGKSVAINTMITSLLYKHSPDQCKFIMIDPKMLELSVYDGIPHLLAPVVTEPGKAIVALKWTVKEMENRYRLMSQLGVRNVDGYNKRIVEAKRNGEELMRTVQTGFDPDTGKPVYEEQPLDMNPLPFIVVVVDEMADLMATAGKEIEVLVQRLAQMARAAGIHIILATQRPSVDVITGVIKANFPTRISFQVTSRHDSRTILNEDGAEQLLGHGDMLYMAGGSRTTRVHGPFVSDSEVESIVNHLKAQAEPDYVEDVTRDEEAEADMFGGGADGDDEEANLYRQAVAIVKRDKKASTSYIQRQLRIGYNRAARLVEQMEHEGVVGPASATGKRDVLID
jgi:DNA segregation ATPase FtsK/SpoIIIE, S-DNA-T family